MKLRASALPAWLDDERQLLHYLVRPHDGHAYAEDLLDAVCLLTSWAFVILAVLAVLFVVIDAIV
ncbi:MAG TPA: hypothetical protein VFX12_06230 [Vicinamibacterales bacterium]|nr:hypothetical protein [Vicinamibacterales bacterium]